MSVETDPVPPVPEHSTPLREDETKPQFGKFISQPWARWFNLIREKINVIDASIVNLAGLTGAGILVKNGSAWLLRSVTSPLSTINVGNPDGTAGDIELDLPTSGVVAGTYGDASNVPHITVDQFGIVLSAVDVPITYPPSGDVVGPASAVDSNVVLFDGTTGKIIKDGGTLGSAAYTSAATYATAAQGATADSAVQPGDNVSDLVNDAGYINAAGAVSAVVTSSITNGDTTHSPSGDAVFDALALKLDKSGGTVTGALNVVGGLTVGGDTVSRSESGIFTPTVTLGGNAASAVGSQCSWVRVGDSVVYSGLVIVTPTAAATTTAVFISIPVASTFVAGTDAGGPATGKASGSPNYVNGQINSSGGTSLLTINFVSATTAAHSLRFSIVYPVQ